MAITINVILMLVIFYVYVFMIKFKNQNRTQITASIINHVLHCDVIYTAFDYKFYWSTQVLTLRKTQIQSLTCPLFNKVFKQYLNSIIKPNFIKVDLFNSMYFRQQRRYDMSF